MVYSKLESRIVEFVQQWFKLRRVLSEDDFNMIKTFARSSVERPIKDTKIKK